MPRKKSQKAGRPITQFAGIGSLFAGYQLEDAGGYITQEFQDYGYRLAIALDDLKHKSLYIKMAKEVPRGLLERALSYVTDANEVKSKAKLFMWRLRQLQAEKVAKAKSDASNLEHIALPLGGTSTDDDKK